MYLVRVYTNDGIVLSATQVPEHPPEDLLNRLVEQAGGDFADVCRSDEIAPVPVNHYYV